jgi:hypothetical protein
VVRAASELRAKKRGAGKFSRASFPYALKLFRGVIFFAAVRS